MKKLLLGLALLISVSVFASEVETKFNQIKSKIVQDEVTASNEARRAYRQKIKEERFEKQFLNIFPDTGFNINDFNRIDDDFYSSDKYLCKRVISCVYRGDLWGYPGAITTIEGACIPSVTSIECVDFEETKFIKVPRNMYEAGGRGGPLL